MSDQHWDIYYRTLGMQETQEAGWRRTQIIADDVDDALIQMVQKKHNIRDIRAYPRASSGVARIEYVPEISVKHEPHGLYLQDSEDE